MRGLSRMGRIGRMFLIDGVLSREFIEKEIEEPERESLHLQNNAPSKGENTSKNNKRPA